MRLYEERHFPSEGSRAEIYARDLRTGHEHAPREYRERRDPGGRAFLLAAEYEPPVEETDDEYPMTAISGRQVYHWHTRTKTGRSPVLQDAAPELFVALSRADAARLGIADGDAVRVSSRRGTVTGPAKVGDVVPEGVVFVPFHYGELERDAAANALMPMAWDPASKQPLHKLAAVRVEKAESDGGAWWREDG